MYGMDAGMKLWVRWHRLRGFRWRRSVTIAPVTTVRFGQSVPTAAEEKITPKTDYRMRQSLLQPQRLAITPRAGLVTHVPSSGPRKILKAQSSTSDVPAARLPRAKSAGLRRPPLKKKGFQLLRPSVLAAPDIDSDYASSDDASGSDKDDTGLG